MWRRFLAAVSLVGVVTAMGTASSTVASASTLGSLGDANSDSFATAINDRGQAVGWFTLPNGGPSHAFLWDPNSGARDLGAGTGVASQAFGINNEGQVVGAFYDQFQDAHAFIWDAANGMRNLGTLPGGLSSVAVGINDAGVVVGTADTPPQPPSNTNFFHAFIWDPAHGMRDLGSPGGPQGNVEAYAINRRGVAVGGPNAFVWSSAAGMRDLLGVISGGAGYSIATAINQKGQVAGSYGLASAAGQVDHAFLWDSKTGLRDLGTEGGASYSFAYGLNNNAEVAGELDWASGSYNAFYWAARTGMVNLGTLGGRYSSARGINKSGEVVGFASVPSTSPFGTFHAFVWTSERGMEDLTVLG